MSCRIFTGALAPYRSVAYRALLKVCLRLLDTVLKTKPPLWVYIRIGRYLKRLGAVRDLQSIGPAPQICRPRRLFWIKPPTVRDFKDDIFFQRKPSVLVFLRETQVFNQC